MGLRDLTFRRGIYHSGTHCYPLLIPAHPAARRGKAVGSAAHSAVSAVAAAVFRARGRVRAGFGDGIGDRLFRTGLHEVIAQYPVGVTNVKMAVFHEDLDLVRGLRTLPPPVSPVEIQPAFGIMVVPPKTPVPPKNPMECFACAPAVPLPVAVAVVDIVPALERMPIIFSAVVILFIDLGNLRKDLGVVEVSYGWALGRILLIIRQVHDGSVGIFMRRLGKGIAGGILYSFLQGEDQGFGDGRNRGLGGPQAQGEDRVRAYPSQNSSS